MTIHNTPHTLAGQTTTLKDGRTYRVEDWWDRVAGESWQVSQTPAAYLYALRAGSDGLPVDNDAGFGHLVHTTEIAETNQGGRP